MQLPPKNYDAMVKRANPPSPVVKDCLWAFFVGGAICLLGEALRQRAFALFFAAHGGPGRQHRRVREYYGIAPSYRHNRQSPFRFV